MNPDEISGRLPHAFPFRMIDRILQIEPGKKVVAIKNVSFDEPFLQGRFLKEPFMPIVLILEAMAQTGGIAFHSLSGTGESGVPFLAGVDEFRLKKKVVPGDQMVLDAEILHTFSHLAKVRVTVQVGEETVAEGTLVLAKGPPMDR